MCYLFQQPFYLGIILKLCYLPLPHPLPLPLPLPSTTQPISCTESSVILLRDFGYFLFFIFWGLIAGNYPKGIDVAAEVVVGCFSVRPLVNVNRLTLYLLLQ